MESSGLFSGSFQCWTMWVDSALNSQVRGSCLSSHLPCLPPHFFLIGCKHDTWGLLVCFFFLFLWPSAMAPSLSPKSLFCFWPDCWFRSRKLSLESYVAEMCISFCADRLAWRGLSLVIVLPSSGIIWSYYFEGVYLLKMTSRWHKEPQKGMSRSP